MAQYAVTATALVIPVNNGNAPNGNNVTVSVIPGSGNTSLVEFSTSIDAVINSGAANWQQWGGGTVSAASCYTFFGKMTALRLSRVSGSSTDVFEVIY